ncbi:MAG: hypothetical protein RLZZ393_172, partial [Pseudomonadota bacterium]
MSVSSVYFIDSRVPDYQQILLSLPEGSTWYLIDGSTNGLTQIQSALAGLSGLAAIHVLSHGAAGQLLLGSSVVDAAAL